MRRRSCRSGLPSAVLLLFAAAGPVAAQPAADEAAALGCRRDVGDDIAVLIGGAPLVLAPIRVGTDGTTDPLLAKAVAIENSPRETVNGLEYPSPFEDALARRIADHPCFRAFERAVRRGEADVSGAARAVLQVEMPIAKTYDLVVEYLPGRFRRNLLLHASLGLEIRDGSGRVVFARTYADHYRRTCFWEGDAKPADCLDLNRERLDPAAEWREALDRAVQSLLEGSAYEIVGWRRMLEEQRDDFYDRRYSTEIELSAAQARNRDALALPYLFVKTPEPRVGTNRLLVALDERGFSDARAATAMLRNHYNVLFRSTLDRALRAAIAESRSSESARILLLSDEQSEAFQNAMIIVCAEQSSGFTRENCLEPVYLIERLCDAGSEHFDAAPNPRGDACVLASMQYGESSPVEAERALRGVREAQQHIQAAGYLREPTDPASAATTVCRGRGGDRVGHLVGASETYIRVDAAAENDDALYLVEAAHEVMVAQAECIARHLLERYEAMAKANETERSRRRRR